MGTLIPVTIKLVGCDDETTVDADVTQDGFALLHNLAEWSAAAGGGCQPVLKVEVKDLAVTTEPAPAPVEQTDTNPQAL